MVKLLVAVSVWYQLPKYPKWEEDVRQRAWNDFERDRGFFAELESTLPKGAMVFEFPEKIIRKWDRFVKWLTTSIFAQFSIHKTSA